MSERHGAMKEKGTYTTDDRHTAVAERTRELARLALDLLCKFARRREDERVRTEMSVLVREGRELVDENQHRDDEGGRLTGTCMSGSARDDAERRRLACLRNADDVPRLKTDGDRLPLDG
jgi:hypothetical protein